MSKTAAISSTQKYLDISEVRSDCIILKDGTMRAVLLVSSINFSLKSEDEQKATVSAYVQFLNTLEHPLQIIIQSRRLNIENYLVDLNTRQKEQTNNLLKAQMAEYIDFIKELVDLGEIMTKKFYVVVPYSPMGDKKLKFFSRLSSAFTAGSAIRLKRERFEAYREQLFRRVDNVSSALSSMGLRVVPLDTQSLIELLYNSYNPVESAVQKLAEINKLNIETI
ncbi:MAG: hypothetical protein PHV78_03110 [Patescibacteria group bacterium]|nr:hypothetical protein [Patescibacteria group bacterium]MDD5121625.1 hypothetical protein [Patescibacteria group bacterium]MDD5221940.1 hypothetical protein [Patescibacteria group bacterium]MDD5396211.1 hypothetical protein [Patescibacteria group bacterium]